MQSILFTEERKTMEKNYKEIKRTLFFLACFLPHIAAILVGMSRTDSISDFREE